MAATAEQYRLVIVDPGHFHAALVERDMHPFLSLRVLDYMNRVSLFNQRAAPPTHWELDIRTGPDFFAQMLEEATVLEITKLNNRRQL